MVLLFAYPVPYRVRVVWDTFVSSSNSYKLRDGIYETDKNQIFLKYKRNRMFSTMCITHYNRSRLFGLVYCRPILMVNSDNRLDESRLFFFSTRCSQTNGSVGPIGQTFITIILNSRKPEELCFRNRCAIFLFLF